MQAGILEETLAQISSDLEALGLARESLELIDRRGYDRHKDLLAELDQIMASARDSHGGSP